MIDFDGPTCVERFSPKKNKVGKGKEDQFTSIPRRSMYGMFSYMKTKKYIKLSLYKDPFLCPENPRFPQKKILWFHGDSDVSTINPRMHGIDPMVGLPQKFQENQDDIPTQKVGPGKPVIYKME